LRLFRPGRGSGVDLVGLSVYFDEPRIGFGDLLAHVITERASAMLRSYRIFEDVTAVIA
jgi:hypothetical protein